jgi:hypothetical protein
MLYALIAIAWLAIAVLCWGACAVAARGDGREYGGSPAGPVRRKPDPARRKPGPAGESLVVWEGLPELAVRDARTIAHSMR